MEPQFRTSFIPKKTLGVQKQPKRSRPMGIVSLITLIIFFGTILAAVGIFLYGEYLKVAIERKEEQLNRARGAFEPALIEELTRLDRRIESSELILGNHIALSGLFEFLEANTLENVRFADLIVTSVNSGRMNLTMRGQARGFSAVALQSDVFGESDLIEEPVFSNLDLDSFGNVSFDISAFVNVSLLSYERVVGAGSSGGQKNVSTEPQ